VYCSETSKHRDELRQFCTGYGLDVGFGGDPINDSAVRVDLPKPYAEAGGARVQLGGDCRNLKWFADGPLDYVYSSHLLEDFGPDQIVSILREWTRVLKTGGRIVCCCRMRRDTAITAPSPARHTTRITRMTISRSHS